MTAPRVPDGVPSVLKVGEVAAVLNIRVRQAQNLAARGVLTHIQPTGRGGAWMVSASSVARYADTHGQPIYWETLLG